jgi:hypothetical protein
VCDECLAKRGSVRTDVMLHRRLEILGFHFQEWKKRWQDGRTHVDHAARYDNFRLTQDGIRPLLTTPPDAFATMAAV